MKVKSNLSKWCLCGLLLALSVICFSMTIRQSSAQATIKPSELIVAEFGIVDVSDAFTIGEAQGSVDATGIRVKTKNNSAVFSYKNQINAELLNKDISLFELQFLNLKRHQELQLNLLKSHKLY